MLAVWLAWSCACSDCLYEFRWTAGQSCPPLIVSLWLPTSVIILEAWGEAVLCSCPVELGICAACSLSTWQKLKILEKRHHQLMECLHQTDLWDIFLIVDRWRRPQTSRVVTTAEQVVLSVWKCCLETSKSVAPLMFSTLTTAFRFLLVFRWAVSWKWSVI